MHQITNETTIDWWMGKTWNGAVTLAFFCLNLVYIGFGKDIIYGEQYWLLKYFPLRVPPACTGCSTAVIIPNIPPSTSRNLRKWKKVPIINLFLYFILILSTKFIVFIHKRINVPIAAGSLLWGSINFMEKYGQMNALRRIRLRHQDSSSSQYYYSGSVPPWKIISPETIAWKRSRSTEKGEKGAQSLQSGSFS